MNYITPFDAVRKAARLLDNTRQTDDLCELSPEDLLNVALSCIESDWDVTPDDLTPSEIDLARSGLITLLNKSLERLA